ncbi:MAG: DUF2779 domain-containing protein [Pseudanabaenaceae cyanobacterium bins.68]|nr:DUF2779 domain-containing protein [Pseudanabaenaceae cyanobacterium bins.68]
MNYYLTQSDYKVAGSCPTKLYYKKLGYPTNTQVSAYTKKLAEGRFILEKIAQLLYPEGIAISAEDGLEQAIALTQVELAKEQVILFQPVIYSDRKLASPDILIKSGNNYQIIDVKSKQFDSAENQKLITERGINLFRSKRDRQVNSLWQPYIEDLAYQVWVLGEMLGGGEILPYLLLPDRTKTTQIEQLAAWFELRPVGAKWTVEFHGDLASLQQDHILTLVAVPSEVSELIPQVVAQGQEYLASFTPNLTKIHVPINKSCKNCEYRGNDQDPRDGFRECWGELAEVDPHILDLYQMGRIGGHGTPLVNQLINQGKVSLYDLPMESLTDQAFLHRQLVQIEHTKKQQEWFSPHLKSVLSKYKYPLHFIDFETSRFSIPYHAGMQAFEQVAFQWSCHSIHAPGAAPIHTEWLDLEHPFPNFAFAHALMATIGDTGTVFTWATHENSVLRHIYYQAQTYGNQNLELQAWLKRIVKFSDRDQNILVDMNELTLKHYFHPEMKSRTSLKYVLPAVWRSNRALHQLPFLQAYYAEDAQGEILNPYQTLPKLEIGDQKFTIREGTEAMLIYQDLLFGQYKKNAAIKAKLRSLLSQYCCLDTMAMVIIWLHWQQRLGTG